MGGGPWGKINNPRDLSLLISQILLLYIKLNNEGVAVAIQIHG